MAVEYAFALERPVLSIDVPRRIRNPDYQALQLEPLEVRIRKLAGATLDPGRIDQAPRLIDSLLTNADRYRQAIRSLYAESVFNPGGATDAACQALVSLCQGRSTPEGNQPASGVSQ